MLKKWHGHTNSAISTKQMLDALIRCPGAAEFLLSQPLTSLFCSSQCEASAKCSVRCWLMIEYVGIISEDDDLRTIKQDLMFLLDSGIIVTKPHLFGLNHLAYGWDIKVFEMEMAKYVASKMICFDFTTVVISS